MSLQGLPEHSHSLMIWIDFEDQRQRLYIMHALEHKDHFIESEVAFLP